ncbi:ankyrin-2 ankyrin, partial [Colletotrichum incanum]
MSLFRRKVARLAPPAVLTDKVIPVAYWDHYSRDAVLNVMWRFDHKLDASKLRGALEKLLDRRDGWRRLGARVRLDSSGKLYWHVPETYTEQRPAISYHHKRHNDISIKQHPLASRLRSKPEAAASSLSSSSSSSASSDAVRDCGPWMVEPGQGVDFSPLMRQPGDPTCFEDYLYQDKPMIGLQITTFKDATLVSLGFSHIMWDAMGLKDLLDAWSLTLQGRQSEVIPLIENDPLALLGKTPSTATAATSATPPSPPEQYKHVGKQLGVLQLLTLGLRQALDKFLNKNSMEEFRTVCVPAAYVDLLRKDALQALQHENSSMSRVSASKKEHEAALPVSFLSDGDVLCAWWTRKIIASRVRNPTKSSKTIAILNMMGLRGVMAQAGLLPKSGALVGNAIAPVPALLRARDLVADGPPGLGRVAGALRLAIAQLSTRPQVEALLALQRRSHGNQEENQVDNNKTTTKKGNGKPGLPALFGDGGMHMVVCTNWTKADFFKVDFSPALVNEIGCDGLWDEERVPHSILPSGGADASTRLAVTGAMGCDGLWEGEHVLRSKIPPSGGGGGAAAAPATREVAKPTGVHMHLITAGTPAFLMSIFTILGRDANGDYWIQGILRKEYWAQIEEAVSRERALSQGAAKSEDFP